MPTPFLLVSSTTSQLLYFKHLLDGPRTFTFIVWDPGLSAQVVIMPAVGLPVDDLDLRPSLGFPA